MIALRKKVRELLQRTVAFGCTTEQTILGLCFSVKCGDFELLHTSPYISETKDGLANI